MIEFSATCSSCRLSFLKSKIEIADEAMQKCLPYTLNYQFTCATCSPDQKAQFSLQTASWREIAVTTLANLILERDQDDDEMEHLDICPDGRILVPKSWRFDKKDFYQFIEDNWGLMCSGKPLSNWKPTLMTYVSIYRWFIVIIPV
jgi:hypothetical protein